MESETGIERLVSRVSFGGIRRMRGLRHRIGDARLHLFALGGSAMGKSAMMPPYGKTLTPEEIRSVIAFARAIEEPSYQRPARPGSEYSAKEEKLVPKL